MVTYIILLTRGSQIVIPFFSSWLSYVSTYIKWIRGGGVILWLCLPMLLIIEASQSDHILIKWRCLYCILDLINSRWHQQKSSSLSSKVRILIHLILKYHLSNYDFHNAFRRDIMSYMKELCMHISRMKREWIPGSFIHALIPALEDLSLT